MYYYTEAVRPTLYTGSGILEVWRMDVRIGTFNLNNLFDRFNFEADLGAAPAEDRDVQTTYQWVFVGQGTGPHDPPPQLDVPSSSTPVVRIQTGTHGELINAKPIAGQQALATRIAAINADVLAVQEVENLDALRRFNRDVLAQPYPFEILIEGNDPRFIDVGVLSRLPVASITSHRFEVHPADPSTPIFGRDLLELDVLNGNRDRRLFTLFVTHLKSKLVPFDDLDPVATEATNNARRTRQAETIARVVAARTRPDTRYVIAGDLNDSPDAATLQPMVTGLDLIDGLANVTESRPPPAATPENSPTSARWTNRHAVAKAPDRFELFDQIWLSHALDGHVAHAEIERRIAWSASAAGVGSDHDPSWLQLVGL
jgi:endonuclease/exonuclease/phosphatase family metal-dependent hydrolase